MTPAQALLNSTDELICTTDRSGKVLEGSLSWNSFFSPHRITSILDLFNLEFSHELTRILANDKFSNIFLPKTKVIHPKGDICWVTIKVQLLSNGSFLFILKDQTKETKLSEVLEHVFDSFDIGHFNFDSETQKLSWSSKIFEFFEKDEESFSPTMSDFIYAFGDKHIEYLNNLFNSPLSRKIDVVLPFITEKGSFTWLNIKAKKNFSTPISYSFNGIIQNVTREKLKEILQLSQNVEITCYEKALEKYSIISRTDKDGKIIYANDEFTKISKYSHEELLGQELHVKHLDKELWKSILSGEAWRGEIQKKAKDGSIYWVDNFVIPIMDSEGKLTEIISFSFDITTFKYYQSASKILKNKLELIVLNQKNILWDFNFEDRKLTVSYNFLELLEIDPLEEMNLDAFFSHFQNIDSEKLNQFIASKIQSYLELPCVLDIKAEKCHAVLKLKILRNQQGEAVHLDGICVLSENVTESFGRLKATGSD